MTTMGHTLPVSTTTVITPDCDDIYTRFHSMAHQDPPLGHHT